MFTLRVKGGKIAILSFKNNIEMGKSLLRFQEYFESPKFRGRCFSLREFKRWYKTQQRHGKFSYYTDWSGFNFPSRVLTPFLNGGMGKLSVRERRIVEALSGISGKFYVLGTRSRDRTTLRHEYAHAAFHLCASYRKKALSIVRKLPRKREFLEALARDGYDRSVLLDELHAYLGDGYLDFFRSHKNIKLSKSEKEAYRKASRRLRSLLPRFMRKLA